MSLSANETLARDALSRDPARLGPVVGLLDAANLPGLPERIESRQAEALGLFKGETASVLRDVAPYLIRLPADSLLLRDFLNDSSLPWAMWRKRPGVLLQTDLDLAALARHLRRFLRVTTPDGMFFFRFWEPASARAYFDTIASSEDRPRWFFPREGGQIQAIMIPDAENDLLHIYRSGQMPAHRDWDRTPFMLRAEEVLALRETPGRDQIEQLISMMTTTFPATVNRISAAQLEQAIRRSVMRAREVGISRLQNLFRICAWDLHAAGNFENVDPGDELARIFGSNLPETEKMRQLADRIAILGPANS